MQSTTEYFKRKPELVWNSIEEEIVIIDPNNGYVHLLNSTGKYIFELLESSCSLCEIFDKIQKDYDNPNDFDQVRKEITEYVYELLENGLIYKEYLQ